MGLRVVPPVGLPEAVGLPVNAPEPLADGALVAEADGEVHTASAAGLHGLPTEVNVHKLQAVQTVAPRVAE